MGISTKPGFERLSLRQAEQFARWSIAARYFDTDDALGYDETRLSLIREEAGDNRWSFEFYGEAGHAYTVEMVQPDGLPFALPATMARRLSSGERGWGRLAPK